MSLQHIVVAADESDASRAAVRAALAWAGRVEARVSVVHVGSPRPAAAPAGASVEHAGERTDGLGGVERSLDASLLREARLPMPEVVSTFGIPGIEIPRFAENNGADLLVLGRKHRSAGARLLVGDTADAVARRSRVPCLFVPEPLEVPTRILIALDGTERGFTVLHTVRGFARALGAALDIVTVERAPKDEPDQLAGQMPAGRSLNLAESLNGDGHALRIRRGEVVEEVLAEVEARGASLLAVGYHRGGPPAVLEAGSVARRLTHLAPCAVLTVPL